MFDIGWSELFVVLVVALVVVGPKDLPKLMRWAGYWTNRARMMAGQFQRVMDDMAREAELDKLNKELRDSTRIDMHPGPTSPPPSPAAPAASTNTIHPPGSPPAAPGPELTPEDVGVMPAPTPVVAEIQPLLPPEPASGHVASPSPGPIRAPDLPQPPTPQPVDALAGPSLRPPEP